MLYVFSWKREIVPFPSRAVLTKVSLLVGVLMSKKSSYEYPVPGSANSAYAAPLVVKKDIGVPANR